MKRKLFGMTGVLAAVLLVFGLILAGCNAPTDSGTNSLFTVTFNADGGTPAPAAQSVIAGGKATEPSGVAKAGYTLEGWYKEAALTNKWNFASDTVTANIILYAKWTQNAAGTFTVTFNANGGTPAPAAQNVTSGGKATEPSGVAKAGYTLEGWYKEAALTNKWNFTSDTVTANITLYARWTQNAAGTFTVTFNADGGTPAPAAQNVTSGGKATEPSGVAKAGYTLEGWYKEAALTNKWNFASDTVTANITLYAKWTQNAAETFTVTFNANGGTPVPAAQTVTSGNTATEPEPANMTKTGYTLEGWYKEEAFATRWIFASDTVTANITLYAKWTANSYIVTYDKNATDAMGTTANGSATYGQNFTLAGNGYSRTGYIFAGWYDDAAGSGTAVTAVNPWNITANKTYYAKWTANTYTVEFNKNNVSASGSMSNQTFTYDTAQSLTANGYTLTDYTFAGWATTFDGNVAYTDGQSVNNLTATQGGAVTLYAKWEHTPGELTTRTVSGQEIKFRYVPSGKFQRDDTAANVTVITKGYWLGETEVTQELFQAVMGTNPSNSTSNPADGETQEKRPVECVWYAAIAFCNKLSVLDGKQPVYSVSGINNWLTLAYSGIPTTWNATWNAVTQDLSKNGYRLPTEMEWMWAAMGADKTTQPNTTGYNKAFAGSNGSNNIGDYAWYTTNSSSKTHEVGTKTVNELNLFDMSGNVWEWVWDWHGSYSSGELTDPAGPASSSYRVCRGGSWHFDASDCAVAYRDGYAPYTPVGEVGFRVLAPQ